MQGVEDELVHGARVPEPHLGLRRMHVHVHLTRVDLQKQDEGGMAVVVQHVLVGLPDRVRRELVAHEAAVHEEILRIAAAARMRRQPDRAVQPQTRRGIVDRQRRRLEIAADERSHPLGERLGLQADAFPSVVLEREADVRARQGDALHDGVAMGELGRFRLEKAAPRRGVEVEIARLDAGAARERRRSGLRDVVAARRDRPRVLVAGAAARQAQVRHGGDAGERLAAKAEARHLLQVVEGCDLARGVRREREPELVAGNAAAIVGDLEQFRAAAGKAVFRANALPRPGCSRAVP